MLSCFASASMRAALQLCTLQKTVVWMMPSCQVSVAEKRYFVVGIPLRLNQQPHVRQKQNFLLLTILPIFIIFIVEHEIDWKVFMLALF